MAGKQPCKEFWIEMRAVMTGMPKFEKPLSLEVKHVNKDARQSVQPRQFLKEPLSEKLSHTAEPLQNLAQLIGMSI